MRHDTLRLRLIKSLTVTLLLAVMTIFTVERFRIGIDLQSVQCLDRGRVFLIDLAARDFERGDLIVFDQPMLEGETEIRPTRMIKEVIGLPGDQVAVIDEAIAVNQIIRVKGFPHRREKRIKLPKIHYPMILGPTEYFAIGTHPRALDSRYLGPISDQQIQGKAHALFD